MWVLSRGLRQDGSAATSRPGVVSTLLRPLARRSPGRLSAKNSPIDEVISGSQKKASSLSRSSSPATAPK